MFSLILVDYNSLDKTIDYARQCRTALGEEGGSHVVIVENGTPEKPVEMLTETFGEPKVRLCDPVQKTLYCFEKDGQEIVYCDSGANLGYARGNNLGVKIADAVWNDPFYIISNNDLLFPQSIDLARIKGLFAERSEVGVIGPAIITPAGEQQSPRKFQGAFQRLIVKNWIGLSRSVIGAKAYQKLWDRYVFDTVVDAPSGRCDWVSGCFFFVAAEAFHRAGMFDEHTFLYGEEIILSKRMEAAGYQAYFCKDIQVVHNHAQTTREHLDIVKITEIDFFANCYVYETYMGTAKWLIACAKGNFKVYKGLVALKRRVAKLLAR